MCRSEDLKFINYLRERNIWCNAKIISNDGKSFQVHSYVMMTSSDFFWAAFQFGPNEGKKGPARTKVYVPCVDSSTLELVIKFAYLDQVEITRDNVWALLKASDFLQMQRLTVLCLAFMQDNMSFATCSNLLELTNNRLYLPSLRSVAERYALHHLCDPRRSLWQRRDVVQQLTLDVLVGLLASDSLNAPREELVWETILSWVGADPTNRGEHLPRLLDTLRLGLLPSQFVAANVLAHDAVRGSSETTQLVEIREREMQQWLLLDEPTDSPPLGLRPRMPHSLVLCVGGWVGQSPCSEVLVYDPQANHWSRVPAIEPIVNVAYHGLVMVGDFLYAVGGSETTAQSVGDSGRCMRLDINTLSWQRIAPLQCVRNFVSCVALNGKVYAMGGRTSNVYRNDSAEVYDPEMDEWRLVPAMTQKRSDAGCAVLHDKIYMVGGFTGEEVLSSVERFDPNTGTWETIPDMQEPRSGLRCVAHRGLLFVVGGYSGSKRLKSAERFDPALGEWTLLEPMKVPRSNLGLTVLGDTLVAAGGFSGGSTDSAVEAYDIFEDRWYFLSPLPSARSALNMVTLEGAAGLAARLLGSRRDSPDLAERARDRPRPAHVTTDRPVNVPLPATNHVLQDREQSHEEWQDGDLHPGAMALLLQDVDLAHAGWFMADVLANVQEDEDDDEEEQFDEDGENWQEAPEWN